MLEAARRHSDHSAGLGRLAEEALSIAKTLPPGLPFLEIGTRAGGSALLFLDAIRESGVPRPLITVDPYGKPYLSGPGEHLTPGAPTTIGYPPTGEECYREAQAMLSSFAREHGLIHIHYRMTSESFFRLWDSESLWINGKEINSNPFGLVYLDGEHTPEAVGRELTWARERLHGAGLIVIDDVQHIRESQDEAILRAFAQGEEDNLRLYVKSKAGFQPANGNDPRFAVVTIACGEIYERMARITHPSLKAYAKRIGADFAVISESERSSPHWEKFQLYDLLSKYDRIIYLDTDLIVRGDCPNLFEVVPEDSLGLFNEAPFVEDRKWSLWQTAEAYGQTISKWDGNYFNTGVMVVSRRHKHLFRKPEKEIFNFYEQSYLNMVIAIEKPKIHKLSYRFNRMTCCDSATGEERHGSYLIHYAGFPNFEHALMTMRGDLSRWKQTVSKMPVLPQKHILIDVHGGLGDQAQAEPAIRFALKHVWSKTKGDFQIDIKTHWPRLFEHLAESDPRVNVFEHGKWTPEPSAPYRQINTLPGPTTINWQVVSNLLCHTVDFCSMALLRRTLPIEDKRIHLEAHQDALQSVLSKTGLTITNSDDLSKLVLVHPGVHWESKTLPLDWWQEVVDGLAASGLSVCLIGQDEETRGVHPLTVPEGAIDLRNRTTLSELIALLSQSHALVSNDSGPVHLAGAFENWIVLIPTCKHPEHLLPWRHGSQEYKTLALRKRDMIDDLLTDPTEIEPDPRINGEFLPPGMSWGDYLLPPEKIIEHINRIVEQE